MLAVCLDDGDMQMRRIVAVALVSAEAHGAACFDIDDARLAQSGILTPRRQ